MLFLCSAAALHAQATRLWRPEERVLITSFLELGGVTADLRRVYAASPNGLEIYDYASGVWESPVTVEDGFPVLELPTSLAHDALEGGVWIGTASGNLYVYRPLYGRVERVTLVGGSIVRIVPGSGEAQDAVYLQSAFGWARLPRGSSFAQPVADDSVPRVILESALDRLRSDPVFQAVRGTIGADERLRRWPLTGSAPGPQPGRYWLATRGGNLLAFDSRRMAVERLRFGLLTRGVAAIAVDGEQLWFGGDGRGTRRGVTRADQRLQSWRHYEAGYDGAPGGVVEQIVATEDAVWFAATDGLFRYDRRTDRMRDVTGPELPADEILALAAARASVWVGTRNGLVRIAAGDSALARTFLPGTRIRSLLLSRDTLWIASDAGAWLLTGADNGASAVPAPGTERDPALRGPVVALRPALGAVYALTERALYRYDGTTWSGPLAAVTGGGLRRLRALAAAAGQLWVAGDQGVARWDQASGQWTYYRVPEDIPEGPVRAVVPAGDFVWLATPAGVLRLEWRR